MVFVDFVGSNKTKIKNKDKQNIEKQKLWMQSTNNNDKNQIHHFYTCESKHSTRTLFKILRKVLDTVHETISSTKKTRKQKQKKKIKNLRRKENFEHSWNFQSILV